MPTKEDSRRNFLHSASAGFAVFALSPASIGHPARATLARDASSKFSVREYGAAGDGKTLDTAAINKAIESASAAGGGTVIFPAGTYASHSIHLKSNVGLYLDHGAVLLAADAPSTAGGPGYDPPEPNQWDHFQDFGHSHWHNSLIWGEGLEDLSITGPGRIWGKGLERSSGDAALKPGVGNKSIALKNCRNVTLRDFSILHAGHFGLLATGVDNLTIDNLRIDTNRDGLDIDCCKNVRVSDCSINSPWDDAIVPKSSFGLGYARATENLTIANCYVTGGYEEGTLLDGTFKKIPPGPRPFRTGRIKFGTEANGGFKNITVSNCVFEDCHGLAFESVDGALLEDISVTNITMREIQSAPIFMRLGARMRGPEGVAVGRLRRINLSNIVVSNSSSKYSCILSGIPGHEIEDVRIHDVMFRFQGGGTSADAALALPEKENAYPEPTMFGVTPTYGFFVRHVRGLEMSGIDLRCENSDARPAILLEDVKGAEFCRVKAYPAAGASTFVLKNVEGFSLVQSRPLADTYLDRAEDKRL